MIELTKKSQYTTIRKFLWTLMVFGVGSSRECADEYAETYFDKFNLCDSCLEPFRQCKCIMGYQG